MERAARSVRRDWSVEMDSVPGKTRYVETLDALTRFRIEESEGHASNALGLGGCYTIQRHGEINDCIPPKRMLCYVPNRRGSESACPSGKEKPKESGIERRV